VLDTGSSITIVSAEIFAAFTASIYADAAFVGLFGTTFFDAGSNCETPTQTKAELDELLPRFAMTFDGPTPLTLDSPATESYLLPIVDDHGTTRYCAGIREYDFPINVLLGDNLMIGKVLVFDRANGQEGFAPAPCPG
jgi:hypothetical protein